MKTFKFVIIFFFSILLLAFFSCNAPIEDSKIQLYSFSGQTMGTSYNMVYAGKANPELKKQVDSLLLAFDFSASTYNPKSEISKFNKNMDNAKNFSTSDKVLPELLKSSSKIFLETNGSFDPSIMPLVNYYGFGYKKDKVAKDDKPQTLDSLKQLVGFSKIEFWEQNNQLIIKKPNPRMELDFNAIAKGYGVDLVGNFFQEKGINSFLIEIGGEMLAKGKKLDGSFWKVSVDKPDPTLKNRIIQAGIHLNNQAMATSGNYRNFYEENGKKFVHTINPKTALPEMSNLLSASIIAGTCKDADAYATACMVMGLEKAKAFITRKKLQALLIYADDNGEMQTWQTEGLKRVF